MVETFEQALRRLAPTRRRDPIAYVTELAALADIRSPAMRHRRAIELSDAIHTLQQVRRIVGMEPDLLFRNDRAYVDVDGVWLDCADDAYYLRHVTRPRSAGRTIAEMMARHGLTDPRCFLDLGAFQGEVALWITKQFPACMVHAVEPGSKAFASLQRALEVQPFDTSNLRLYNLAIGGHDGSAVFSCSRATENSLFIREEKDRTETVEVRTLDTFLETAGIETVDFIKFDIEHAEPLTVPFFEQQSARVRMMLVEYALKGDLEEYGYWRLTDVLERKGFRIVSPIDDKYITAAELKDQLLKGQAGGSNGADVLFVSGR